ncbi:MAG: restriction endonuclease, partial [Methylotenera sp.]|nr:restriction endonuclease [Flavobacterium sp.]
VSLQSQVYTPRWVVEFLVHNSLGKLYLEMYPDSEIKELYKIANAPKIRVREPKPLHELKLIDPASGSGNFLLYAFAFFYALYKDQIDNYGADYDEDDIPKLIIENNLHGIDLDDRAAQLAQLGLWIKAKQKNRNTTTLNFNVVSSDFFLPDFEEVLPIFESGISDQNQRKIVEEIWSDLQQAHKFGSLVKIEEKLNIKLHGALEKQNENQVRLFDADTVQEYERFTADFFKNLETAVAQYATQVGNSFLTNKTKDAITFLKLIAQKYDVATANPPFTDGADFGPDLKKFIETNYKKPHKFHKNLYTTFIKRCFELTNENGKVAMIHPLTFMYIKIFEDVRKFILEKTHISIFVDYSADSTNLFDGSFASASVFYVLEKNESLKKESLFISLERYTRTPHEKNKKSFFAEALKDFIENKTNIHNYKINQEKFNQIESNPFIYWISDDFRKSFKNNSVDQVLDVRAGIQTSNNDRFLRFWWEVTYEYNLDNHSRWITYSKGGPYQKWYGNLWAVIDWEEKGVKLQKYLKSKGQDLHAQEYYFREGITYSALGGGSFRYLPKNTLFDIGGSCAFPNKYENIHYSLAFMNSKIIHYITSCLNPTVNTQVGDIKRVPFAIPSISNEKIISSLCQINIEITKNQKSKSLCEPIFKESPLLNIQKDSFVSFTKSHFDFENFFNSVVLVNEAIINEKIFEVYGLNNSDKAMVLAKEGESIGSLPITAAAKQAYLQEEIAEFPLNNIKKFIENLPEAAFTIQEREAIEQEFPSLYQSNNDLEEFCIRHQINPINVWHWFKESNVIPKQRMNTLAMEFLADMIREILMEDDDGIIPLVPNAGEKILLDRIEEKFLDKGFYMAQYSAFDGVLGRNIKEYINGHFFKALSDHLNLFMYLPKTPFIWHLTSGPEQGFDCYIIIYKWNRDKLVRI